MPGYNDNTIKGRGAQSNPANPFIKQKYVSEHIEGIDEFGLPSSKTQFFIENAKKIVNKVDSPDLGLMFSMNPYQGCEHGCVYCYARNSHQYWGLNAGLDFESKIIIKENAAELLEKAFLNKNWNKEQSQKFAIMLFFCLLVIIVAFFIEQEKKNKNLI